MTGFYKSMFQDYLKDFMLPSAKRAAIFEKYCNETMPQLFGNLSKVDVELRNRYLSMMTMLVFAHQHNKSHDYITSAPVHFDVVRDPMYKYSQRAQDAFFGEAEFAFLFAFFARPEF